MIKIKGTGLAPRSGNEPERRETKSLLRGCPLAKKDYLIKYAR
jgi:hypothetical protein